MDMRRSFESFFGNRSRKKVRRPRTKAEKRALLLEPLERRELLDADAFSPPLGPQLISVNPNAGDIFNFDADPGINPGFDNILDIAPRELTLRFDGNSVIDAAMLDGIRITQSGFDGSFRDDFNTGGAVQLEITQIDPLLTDLEVVVTKSNHSSSGGPVLPTVSVSGMTITVDLNTDPSNLSTAADFVQVLRADLAAAALVDVAIVAGNPTQEIATTADASTEIGPNIVISPGFIGFGESDRIVIARFAETLRDDQYRIEIFGIDDANAGITGLRDTSSLLFSPTVEGTDRDTIFFELDLGAQVTAIVPQPVSRTQEVKLTGFPTGGTFRLTFDGQQTGAIPFDASAALLQDVLDNLPNVNPEDVGVIKTSSSPHTWNVVFQGRYAGEQVATMTADPLGLSGGANPNVLVAATSLLSQTRDQIIVYFNNDDLLDDVTSAENPDFYQLIFTNDTVRNTGGVDAALEDDLNVHLPASVTYYPELDKAVLEFMVPIDELTQPGTYRLRIGNDESIPVPPVQTTIEDPADSFGAANNIGTLTATGQIFSQSIDAQTFVLDFPGDTNEPGHRDIPANIEFHNAAGDSQPGPATQSFNFRDDLPNGFLNAITEAQKERAREIYALFGAYLGIQFTETANQGTTIATGDLGAGGGVSGPGGTSGLGGAGLVILDFQDFTSPAASQPFGGWFNTAFHEVGHSIGLGHASELPSTTVMRGGGSSALNFGQPIEPDYPGDHDIVHGTFAYRPDSKDIDMYKFSLSDSGLFFAETISERLANSSHLDSYLRLYRELPDGTRTLIAQNDDYFSEDSFIELSLEPGVYYVGVSASGNNDYDPRIIDSGIGGRTSGSYDLRLNFRPSVNDSIVDASGTAFDGDLDGIPGGVHNFWFQAKPLQRVLDITGDGTTFSDGETLTIVDGSGVTNRFEFDLGGGGGVVGGNVAVVFMVGDSQTVIRNQLVTQINTAFGSPVPAIAMAVGTTRIMLSGERSVSLGAGVVGIAIEGKTIFVDKMASANSDGSLSKPFNNISKVNVTNAFANTHPGDIVRIVGNGGIDGDLSTQADAFAYEIGFGGAGNGQLSDGSTMVVPRNVITMIDSGAVFKLRQARIGVGSTTASVDNSGAAIQVLGTPVKQVYFTSYDDETLGVDTNPVPTTPSSGNWGGITIQQDVDRGQGRFRYDKEGIFLNYINQADIKYGGGTVVVNSNLQVVNPIDIVGARPTVTFNTISNNASAAIAADPNSFEETNFNAPPFQVSGSFTSDYSRVGPDISRNRLVNNSNNGLFVRIKTLAGGTLVPMTVSGRFDDTDVVHILSQNLIIQGTPPGPRLLRVADGDAPPVTLVTYTLQAGGTLPPGSYNYQLTYVDINGNEGVASGASATSLVLGGAPGQGTIRLDNLPPVPAGDVFVGRRLYRSQPGGGGTYQLVTQLDGSATTYIDDGVTAGGPLSVGNTLQFAKTDARLSIDPGTVLKLENARIETTFGAQLLAEGQDGQQIVFTSRLDDRYGSSGTFDTNNNGSNGNVDAEASFALSGGSWGGLYVGHTGTASIDQVLITYGGGIVPLEGDFAGFNAIEIHQADVRITNTVVERNDRGTGGSAPSNRFGRLSNAAAAIFVRGAQPIIVDNVIRNNDSPAISINANALVNTELTDYGRSTGAIDQITTFVDNRGPLVRRNELSSLPGDTPSQGGINGMQVRGETLTTQSVWDDTDIVHVVRNTVYVSDVHTNGGLRLQSSPTESLVVKLSGDAGFTATGTLLDIDDRIGGMLHIVGQPGFPVILTSLSDDGIGAGFQPNGLPQIDTNNNGVSAGLIGDWNGILLDQNSQDRNVKVIVELEAPDVSAPGVNATPNTAQPLGALAADEKSSDDNLRLGFTIYGIINAPNDVDVYSFGGVAGTEVWLDVDRTTHRLDSVIELIDANGNIIAQSQDSDAETKDVIPLYEQDRVAVKSAVLQNSLYNPTAQTGFAKDHWTTNPRDAGFRVVLPGTKGETGTYHIRIRSSNIDRLDPTANPADLQDPSKLLDGITSGVYQLQVRLSDQDEFAGSTIRFADIRYADVGITIRGLPKHSPLLGESTEDTTTNGTPGTAQDLGNLLVSDRAVLSVGGNLSSNTDIDFYRFAVNYPAVQNISGASPTNLFNSVTFDLDYAYGLGGPDTEVVVYDSAGRVILISEVGHINDDLAGPLEGLDIDDLTRGSASRRDAFIGPVELPISGTYSVSVTSKVRTPQEVRQPFLANPANSLVRREPVNSVGRVVEDHVAKPGYFTTAAAPQVVQLLDTVTTDPFSLREEAVVPWTLSDVTLFVQTTESDANTARLLSVDPFTGAEETTFNTFNRDVGDIALRPNVHPTTTVGTQLFAFSHDLDDSARVDRNDAGSGNLIAINTGTGQATNLDCDDPPICDDGIQTYELDPQSDEPAAVLTNPNGDGDRFGDGVQFNATAFGAITGSPNTLHLFAVGDRQFLTPNGVDPTKTSNILYKFDPDTGVAISVGPLRADLGLVRGAGTDVRELGNIDTPGQVTGMAFLNGTVYVADDQGNLRSLIFPPDRAWSSFIANVTDPTGGSFQFEALSAGPRNVENGAYSNLLFGINSSGRIIAIDPTAGATAAPIFFDGADFIETGQTNVRGLAFSNLDVNLWHVSRNREGDAGHGVVTPFDGSRTNEGPNTSYYFGFEAPNNPSPNFGSWASDTVNDPDLRNSYDFPGGASGSLISNEFSLVGYHARDLPALYFSYYLETENASHLLTDNGVMSDSFRVFISSQNGAWQQLGTSNAARTENPTNDDEYDFSDSNFEYDLRDSNAVTLFDVGEASAPNTWRQARIVLPNWAGRDNLRLRFDFSTAGSMNVGDTLTTGTELRAVDGTRLRDGQTITLFDNATNTTTTTFEVDMGNTLVVPSGAEITPGETFTIDPDGIVNGNERTFTFVSDLTGALDQILVNSTMSAATVAARIEDAIDVRFPAIPTHLDDHRVNLEEPDGLVASPRVITQSAGAALFIEGTPGVTGLNERMVMHSGMTSRLVAQEIVEELERVYDAAMDPTTTIIKSYADVVRLINHDVQSQAPGPFIGQTLAAIAGLDGDQFGGFSRDGTDPGGPSRGVNNAFEGVYLDDIIIGFRERGEMIINANPNSAYATFTPGNITLEGDYQLEIRRSEEFGVTNPNQGPAQILTRTFDTNDRLAQQTSLVVSEGNQIADGQTLTISDGVDVVTFEFEDQDLPVGNAAKGINTGNIQVLFRPTDSATVVAARLRNAINSFASQAVLDVTARLADENENTLAGTSARVDLFGNAVIVGDEVLGEMKASNPFDDNEFYRFKNLSEAGDSISSISLTLPPGVFYDTTGGGVQVSPNSSSVGETIVVTDNDHSLTVTFTDFDYFEEFLFKVDVDGPGSDSGIGLLGTTALITFDTGRTVTATFENNSANDPGVAGTLTGLSFQAFGQNNGKIEHGDGDEYGGDQNRPRDQGQLIIHSNFISNSRLFGILSDAGDRSGTADPNPGPVRNLQSQNLERLTTGVTIINNVLDNNLGGGIRFSGQTNAAGNPLASVPFGRIVNNTIYGVNQGDTGILVDQNASPTLLNNILANLNSGISIDASSSSTAIGSNVFQSVATNSGLGFSPINLSPTDPLFIGAPARNFYLASDSLAIDSALDALNDRTNYVNTKSPSGIAASPILAPDRDVVGQLRADGDNTSGGSGANPFKDRGAFDRVDEGGPTAQLLNPRDNDTEGDDIDPTDTVVQLIEGTLDQFSILLVDGEGTGPDPNTLTNLSVSLTEDGRALTEGIDYTFGFNTTSRTIRLTPLSGIWKPSRTYEITLNNRDRFVVVAPDGASVIDGNTFSISDAIGNIVTYEYESGFVITVPQTLTLELPDEGALPGGIVDGETFTIDDGLTPTTFEFDSNNNVSGSNVRIGFTNADLQTELATAVVDAIDGLDGTVGDGMFGLGLSPRDLGGGVIHLGSRTNHTLTLSGSGILTSSGSPTGVDDGDTFIIDYNGQIVRYEFDANTVFSGLNQQIPFTFFDTNEQIADKIVAAIDNFNPSVTDPAFTLDPVHFGEGKIHVGGEVGLGLDTLGSGLFQVGAPGVQGSLTLAIPAAGGGPGGITNGETFTISNGLVSRTFEFNADGSLTPGNIAINFRDGSLPLPDGMGFELPSTQLEMAANVASVIGGVVVLNLTPTDLLNGQIRLNESASHTVDTTLTNVATTGVSGGSVPVPFIPDGSFGGDQMAFVIINTVNVSSTAAFARLRAGSTIFISDATAISGIGTISSPGNRLRQLEGIKDVAGNNLQPNRANNETQFTIILAGAKLDHGDAPDPFDVLDAEYPTLRAGDGARHVLVPDQIFLGAGVDSESDGQPTRVANGDDADHVLDVSASNLAAAGLAPFNVTTAALGAGRDMKTFILGDGTNSVTFEFDLAGSPPVIAGNVAIPFNLADDIDTIVDSIVTVVEAQLVPTVATPLAGFNPTNLGGGQLYLGGSTNIHTLGLGTSDLAHTGQLPASVTAVGAGLALEVPALSGIVFGSSVMQTGFLDGERFTIDDGVNPPVTFELDETLAGPVGVSGVNRAILFNTMTDTAAILATKVAAAITQSFTDGDLIDLMPAASGNMVDLPGATTDTSVDTSSVLSPNLDQLNPVADGHSFTIDPDGGGGIMPLRFEFDSGGGLFGVGTKILFNLADSANDIADSIVATIVGLGLSPVNLGDAMIDLGGTTDHNIITALSPNLVLTGTPGGIADGQIFTIDDGNRFWEFEFDRNSSVAVGKIPVTFLPGNSATDIGAAITAAVNASAIGMSATDLGSGTVDLATDDEDGVSFDYVINPNVVTSITVEASSSGLLDGWIDYNQDGDWDDFGEKIFDSVVLNGGTNSLEFTAPGFALVGETFARFRFSVGGRTFPTGVIVNGEVEDYLVNITPGTPPVVVNDAYTTEEDKTIGPLVPGDGVLANDLDNENEGLVVSEVNGTAANVGAAVTLEHGGTVTVSADGTFVYNPTTSTILNQMAVGEVMTESFTYRANDLPACGPPCTKMISNNTATVTITVTGVNDDPVITSDGGLATASVNIFEDTTAVTTVTATDPDLSSDTLTFSLPVLGAADQALFTIDGSSGELAFLVAPNYEIPSDANTDGVYEVKVMVNDGNGGMAMQAISVTVDDANDDPTITSDGGGATAAVNVAENTTAVTTVTAADVDVDAITSLPLTFSLPALGAADQALFTIDGTSGELAFLVPPNFEIPSDANSDGVYEVKVMVNDGEGGMAMQAISVTVDDANEDPVITSDGGGAMAAVNVAENTTAVTTVVASDVDAVTSLPDTLTFSLPGFGAADQALFTIDGSSGALAFLVAPNFEIPSDANTDGVYEVKVLVNDGNGGMDMQAISITVDDANDDPLITSGGGGATAAVNVAENTTAVTTVTAADVDVDPITSLPDTLTFSLPAFGAADQARFTIDGTSGELAFLVAPNFEIPTDANTDGVYEVKVVVSDGESGMAMQVISVTVDDANDAPVITSDGGVTTAAVNVAESTTAVTSVVASDEDVDAVTSLPNTLTFSLPVLGAADQARFTIDGSSGALTFLVPPDFENPTDANTDGVYEVKVMVNDGEGGMDMQAISVTVTDANEPWQNPRNNKDVNDDGIVSPQDALIIINRLNSGPNASVLDPTTDAPRPPYYDVNGDNIVSPADVLIIINFINKEQSEGEGEGAFGGLVHQGEGEMSPVNVDAFGFLPLHSDRPVGSHQDVGPRRNATADGKESYFGQLGNAQRFVPVSRLASSRSSDAAATSRVDEILDDFADDVAGVFGDDPLDGLL